MFPPSNLFFEKASPVFLLVLKTPVYSGKGFCLSPRPCSSQTPYPWARIPAQFWSFVCFEAGTHEVALLTLDFPPSCFGLPPSKDDGPLPLGPVDNRILKLQKPGVVYWKLAVPLREGCRDIHPPRMAQRRGGGLEEAQKEQGKDPSSCRYLT